MHETLIALAKQVKDQTKPVEERRNALRIMAKMKNEPEYLASQVPDDQMGAVASAVAYSTVILHSGLSFRDSMESVRDGFVQRGAGTERR